MYSSHGFSLLPLLVIEEHTQEKDLMLVNAVNHLHVKRHYLDTNRLIILFLKQ